MTSMRHLRVKSLDSIGQYGALEMRRVFPLSCSNDTLLDVFTETCIKNGFIVTERAGDKATAIKEATNMYVSIRTVNKVSFQVSMCGSGISSASGIFCRRYYRESDDYSQREARL